MKNTILTLLFLQTFLSAHSQSYHSHILVADDTYRKKNYVESLKSFKKAFSMKANNKTHLYNGACVSALAGDESQAIQWLIKAIEIGWCNVEHLKVDHDLTSLHSSVNWDDIVKKAEKRKEEVESLYDLELKKELEDIYSLDQAIRKTYKIFVKEFGLHHHKTDSISKSMHAQDSLNQARISQILEDKGWVGSDIVGTANIVFFAVIQHADIEYQKTHISYLKDATITGDIDPSQLAYLEDRIALREGKKQIYGSQISWDKVRKKKYLAPLIDPVNVDDRRSNVGLGPISAYLDRFGILWNLQEFVSKSQYYDSLYFAK